LSFNPKGKEGEESKKGKKREGGLACFPLGLKEPLKQRGEG